ncbi:MAG: cbb3-type cytochrome c oxidase subunit I [Bacillota bacterium]
MASIASIKPQAENFRTCKVTGYQVYRPVEKLVLFNAVCAVLMLALGGTLALLMALTRYEVIHLLPMELFYRFLTTHGMVMLVFWIVFFEVAALQFGMTVLLNQRMMGVKFAYLYTGLMTVGAITATATALAGKANIMFSAYPPMTAHPAFYLGIILFAVGALCAACQFVYSVWRAKKEGAIEQNMPLVIYALLTAAIIAIWTLLHGAAAYVPAFLQSVGLIKSIDAAAYRLLFWGFGHGAQQVNLAAMVAAWYALAALTTGARPVHEGLSRAAFVLYLIGINLGSIHHLLVDPGLGLHNRIINTSYLMYAAALGSLIHAFSIPAAVETAQRARGFTRGIWDWLKRAPWDQPGFSALVISFTGFGFIAGVSGVMMGTMQLNMLIHNTLFVVGHFHSTVVLGATLSFMGLSYYVVPLMARRDLAFPKLAKWQPYVYGFGLLILIGGMMLSGKLGAPRRSWDMSYENAAISVDILSTPAMSFATMVLAIGAVIAVTGGAMFVLIMVATVFFGKTSDAPNVGTLAIKAGPQGPVNIVPIPEVDHSKKLDCPATLRLVYIFLAWFAIMFFIGFANLARVKWFVG